VARREGRGKSKLFGPTPRLWSRTVVWVACLALAAGSLMFTPDISLAALRAMRDKFGAQIYKHYGFVDAFNPTPGWTDADVIGIDVGIKLLSAENLRTGNVWRWFMSNPEIPHAMGLAGVEKY
jgi:hypothetical protein